MENGRLPLVGFGRRSGFKVRRVSIGGMRLPGDPDQAVELLRYAIDRGMCYIDTSRGYGESEIKIGKALKDGYREKVILSTKWAPWIHKYEPADDASADCVLRRIEESMKRLDVSYLDFYQVWNIQNPDNYGQAVRKGGFVDGICKAKDRGLVGHIGITSHDKPENLLRYLDEMDWCEVLLVSYNMLSSAYAPVLAKAKAKGIGTIVMNPVAGGKLAEDSPVFDDLVTRTGSRSLADLAIRYLMANSNIDTIISGISKRSDIDATLASAAAPPLDPTHGRELEAFVAERAAKNVRFCTACNYCMPCPFEVNIPKVMDAIYDHRFLGFKDNARRSYQAIGKSNWIPGKTAEACTNCRKCVPKCTQKLDIPAEMEFARLAWPPEADPNRPGKST